MDIRGLTPMLTAMREGAAAGGTRAAATGAAAGAAGVSAGGGAAKSAAAPSGSFQVALSDALKSVSQTQQQSAELQRQYTAGSAEVSLEQTMVAMQKSQVAFQAAVTVRNRLVSAYTDIMNMNV